MKTIMCALALTAIVGCTIPYAPQNGNGSGYSDTQINTDSFIVGYKGRHPLRTKELALLHSAEVAIEHGYKYFIVAQVDDLSTIHVHNTGDAFTVMYNPYVPYFYGNTSYTSTRPHYVYTIICFSEKPSTPSYDARMVIENISTKHGFGD